MKRIEWVDIFKGICIILMILGHAWAPFITYIYLFHMPAFIFISGYTFSGDKYSLKDYLKRKVCTLLIPGLLVNVAYIIFMTIADKINIYQFLFESNSMPLVDRFLMLFQHIALPELGGAMWFLVVLFEIEIIYMMLYKMLKKEKRLLYVCVALSLIGWKFIGKYEGATSVIYRYLIDLSLFGLIFFALGRVVCMYQVFEKHIEKTTMKGISIITTILFGQFYYCGTLPMNWPTRQFDNYFIHLFTCFCMFYICYIISSFLEKTILGDYLKFIGRKTFCILSFHFCGFKIASALLIGCGILPLQSLKLLVPQYSPYLNWLFYAAISLISCLILSRISEKNKFLNYVVNAK